MNGRGMPQQQSTSDEIASEINNFHPLVVCLNRRSCYDYGHTNMDCATENGGILRNSGAPQPPIQYAMCSFHRQDRHHLQRTRFHSKPLIHNVQHACCPRRQVCPFHSCFCDPKGRNSMDGRRIGRKCVKAPPLLPESYARECGLAFWHRLGLS